MNDLRPLIHAERRAMVARLRLVTDDQWLMPSLCEGWSIHDVAAHLVSPFVVSRGELFRTVLRTRSIAKAMDDRTRSIASRWTPGQVVDLLEQNADVDFHPPGLPFHAPFTDIVAHNCDIRWALGDDHDDWGDPARLRPILEFLAGPRARVGFVPPGRIKGLRLVATDIGWQHGEGPVAEGPALSVVMAMLGRTVGAADLRGEGVPALA